VTRRFPETDLKQKGFCILRSQFALSLIEDCREALSPTLASLEPEAANRGPHRHFFPMPFEAPFFRPEFFFDEVVLGIVRGTLGERFVADQWGCDVPVLGSTHQVLHADYQRPLFEEVPDLILPPYMLVVSFGLVDITLDNGPLEIAPGTHSIPRQQALDRMSRGEIGLQTITLDRGDVLIRHPWALHRGTPNKTDIPRPLCTIRYVRRWYADASRDVAKIPQEVWRSLTAHQQELMRFPVET
jgi:ectoine hydroxylase-related dioxygenase (phytanoyl-CoA dioxygenase family)